MDSWFIISMVSFATVLVVAQLWRKVAREDRQDDAYRAALRAWLMELPEEPPERRTIHIRIPNPPPARVYRAGLVGFVVYEN